MILFSKSETLFLRDGYLCTNVIIFEQNTAYLFRKQAVDMCFFHFV